MSSTGAVVLLVATAVVGVLAGLALSLWMLRARLRCPCGHSIGVHRELGPCQAQFARAHYADSGSQHGREWVPCRCTRYYGPVPASHPSD